MKTTPQKLTKTLILLGDSGGGKSKILQRYMRKKYEPTSMQTIGVDYLSKEIKVTDTIEHAEYNLSLCLWDCCGDELESKFLPPSVYKIANGFFIVSSYDSYSSFINIKNWIKHIMQYSSLKSSNQVGMKFDIPIFIVLNKYDISETEKAFSRSQLEENVVDLLNSNGELNLKIYDKVSAKSDWNVEYLFDRMINLITGFNTLSYTEYCKQPTETVDNKKKSKPSKNRRKKKSDELPAEMAKLFKKTFMLKQDPVRSSELKTDNPLQKNCC